MWPLQFFKAMQLHYILLDSAELDIRAERDASVVENEVGEGRGPWQGCDRSHRASFMYVFMFVFPGAKENE